MHILFYILGLLTGCSLFLWLKRSPKGKIEYYLDAYDEDTDVVKCSVKPDCGWEALMKEKSVIFSITMTDDLKESLERNNGKLLKEN